MGSERKPDETDEQYRKRMKKGQMGVHSPNNKIKRINRNRKIIELIAEGKRVPEVAQIMGISERLVYTVRKKAIEEATKPASEELVGVIKLELEMLKRELHEFGTKGDYKKVDSILGIIEKQAKIDGLYANEKKLAEAAALNATANAVQAQDVLRVISFITNGLNLSPEQRALVPELTRAGIERLQLEV